MVSKWTAAAAALCLQAAMGWAGEPNGTSMQNAVEAARAAAEAVRFFSANDTARDWVFQMPVAAPKIRKAPMPGLRKLPGGYYAYADWRQPAVRFQFLDASGAALTPFGQTRAAEIRPDALASVAGVKVEMQCQVAKQRIRFQLRGAGAVLPFSGDLMVLDGEGLLRGRAGAASLQVSGLRVEGWVRGGTLVGTGRDYTFVLYLWDGGADGLVTLKTGESREVHFNDRIYARL